MEIKNEKFSELQFVLEKLISLHRNVIDVLKLEYSNMAMVDVSGLLETSRSKQILLEEIRSHERLRIQLVEGIALSLNLVKAATLQQIVEKLNSKQAKSLIQAKEVLSLLATQAKELNLRNMEFAQASLERIDRMKKNVLGLNNTSNENYSQGGTRQPNSEKGGRLLSTEA